MPLPNLGQSLLRGMICGPKLDETLGDIPLDKLLADDLSEYWDDLRQRFITDINTDISIY